MPPIPDILGGDSGWIAFAVAVVLIVAILWKPIRRLYRAFKWLGGFMEGWNGQPERRDHTGAVIEQARPGVPALLERLRHQVENSHDTNLRDDLDGLTEMVGELRNDLTVHVAIAKESDRRQAETADQVARLAARWADDGSPRPRADT